ncbi:MAG: biopolymer transporter ExbD [Gemmatimonadaceae bacterium]|nr:biopolymer transporter ExbD [Gemmatimonadaceae bacterium]
MSRAREERKLRRVRQFAKFRVTQLNLVPLVDTFVSIVFFALTTTTVGELAPIVPGVTLPEASVGLNALSQLTLGVGANVTVANRPVMTTQDAAAAASDDPAQPLKIPVLYGELRRMADSLRAARGLAPTQDLDQPLAIQADKTMRFDLLSRFMQTARLAGFRRLSLQVQRSASPDGVEVGTGN